MHFWSLHSFPEIVELRSRRFAALDEATQKAIAVRIRKRPPRTPGPKKTEADRIETARLYWAVRELKRIEIAGGVLPGRDKDWQDSMIDRFPELIRMARIDEGFLGSAEARWVPPNPDRRFDLITGVHRLTALESALSSARGGWDDDPAERATDWIRQEGDPERLLADLESIADGGATFSRVWERFGWAHSPLQAPGEDAAHRDLSEEAGRVLALLARLPEETIRQAIEGISYWLDSWKRQVVFLPTGLTVWLRVWPIAIEATNAKQPPDEEIDLSTVSRSSDEHEPIDLDTLNTPAGRLVGVFLVACPNLEENNYPFSVNGALRTMRDTIVAATRRSGLIARHRMIESLPYFLRADPNWANEQLITPLMTDNAEALALWRAIARQTRFTDVLEIIGDAMAERAVDLRLGRETRRSLAFSLVIECLHAFREERSPAVPYARIQQMIRSLDDEVRAHAAEAIQRFIRDLSTRNENVSQPPSREQLFRASATPFLRNVWPQERSLATPGVSRAFADLPAASGDAFAEATAVIERFLVPFECWSLLEYGLHGQEDGEAKLLNINHAAKAEALLWLLDLTIGTSDGDVVPYDLADALDQVRKVAPKLAETPVFRRLATAARRS